MSVDSGYLDEDYFTGGVLSRRCLGWVLDVVVLIILMAVLWTMLFLFGFLTFGLSWGAMAVMPFVPFLYHYLSLLSAGSATPGQRFAGITVRRDADLGPPDAFQALISVLVYMLTLATSGFLLLIALFTRRHRTLHDMISGLVVVRAEAMRTLTSPAGRWNMGGGTSYS